MEHWGLRLDLESLFVARSAGWFESGFSHSFIGDCFKRNGMDLLFFSGGHVGGEIGIASSSVAKLQAVRETAAILGLRELDPYGINRAQEARYASVCGNRAEIFGRPGFTQREEEQGVLMYGPYIDLDSGKYELSLLIEVGQNPGKITIDVVGDCGEKTFFKTTLNSNNIDKAMLFNHNFDIPFNSKNVEVRSDISGGANWSVTLPIIKMIV